MLPEEARGQQRDGRCDQVQVPASGERSSGAAAGTRANKTPSEEKDGTDQNHAACPPYRCHATIAGAGNSTAERGLQFRHR